MKNILNFGIAAIVLMLSGCHQQNSPPQLTCAPASVPASVPAAEPGETDDEQLPVHEDIAGCVRLSFSSNMTQKQKEIVTKGYKRVCAAMFNPKCDAFTKLLSGVNGRTGYFTTGGEPERMMWPSIRERLQKHFLARPVIEVYVGAGGGAASTVFSSATLSYVRFGKKYFRSPSVEKDILHTAVHELLHTLPCEDQEVCGQSEDGRFLDTGRGTRGVNKNEYASYQVGKAFEKALDLPGCE